MAVIVYRCGPHQTAVRIDTTTRHADVTPPPLDMMRPAGGQCYLASHWPDALKDADALVGQHGPWHPRRKGPVCSVVREG